MRIEVVIPAYKPDERLPRYITDLKAAGFTAVTVVDDGGGADYAPLFDELEREGVRVLRHPVNRGKGAALKTAFALLRDDPEVEAVITADCDGQHTAENVQAIADGLASAPGTLVLAQRRFDENTPSRSLAGNRVTSAALRIFYDIRLKDTQTGLRGIPAEMLGEIAALSGDRYDYELNMLMWAKRRGVAFTGVEIEALYFDNNAGSHYRTVVDSLPILYRVLSGMIQYAISAGLSAVVDVAAYGLLVYLLLPAVWPEGVRITVAAVIARTVSSVVNFFCNRHLPTAQNRKVSGTIWKYYCLWAVQLAASVAGTTLLCKWLGLGELLAKLLTDLVLALASYQVQMRWVFAKAPDKKGD